MNIFEIIRSTASRNEPFHSLYFTEMLKESNHSGSGLIRAFYIYLGASGTAKVPGLSIDAEDSFKDGSRIDITIKDGANRRIVGIEIKMSDSSVSYGQLDRYYHLLAEKYPGYRVAIVYLTPFSRGNLPVGSNTKIRATKEFEDFKKLNPGAECGHLNWHEIADLYTENSNDFLAEQHREYLMKYVLDPVRAGVFMHQRNRTLRDFLGDQVVDQAYKIWDDNNVVYWDEVIPLQENIEKLDAIADGLEILLKSDRIKPDVMKNDNLEKHVRDKFLSSSAFELFYRRVFAFSVNHRFAWFQGKNNVGCRVAIPNQPGGVSVFTLQDDDTIKFDSPR
ncbi:MAG: hypothetical protein NTU47_04175 [Ignavibacteriales bacterium]|nr:hypothetical protein [Ignavibacteriales bacterium]